MRSRLQTAHFDATRWSDFIRGLLGGEEALRMSEHLDSGCRSCGRAVAALRRVTALAETDLRRSPKDWAVRSVKAYFKLEHPERAQKLTPLALQLAYDSLLEPAPVGTRSLQASSRQLVYYAQDYALDLRLDYQHGSHQIDLGGEILNRQSGPVSDVPAFLIADDQVVSHSVSGSLGEFYMRCTSEGSLRLCLLVGDEECLDVALDRRRSPATGGPTVEPPQRALPSPALADSLMFRED